MNKRRSTAIGNFTKLFLLVAAGLFFFMMLSCSNDNRNPAPTVQENPAKDTQANGQQYAPRIQIPAATPQEAQLELLIKAAIELCKVETVSSENTRPATAHLKRVSR
jgi:hypothetical protein